MSHYALIIGINSWIAWASDHLVFQGAPESFPVWVLSGFDANGKPVAGFLYASDLDEMTEEIAGYLP